MKIFQCQRDRLTNDGNLILGGLELPEGNVDGDTTLTLGLELVKNPRVLERTLTEFGGFLYTVLASAGLPTASTPKGVSE